jgi:RNA polymerase sigma-70 factor (ECF subfamily)
MSDSPSPAATAILEHRPAFKAFLAARLGGNESEAEDLLQNGLVKALERAGEIRNEEKAVAWFYQLLRNTLIDHQRSRAAAAKREAVWADHALTNNVDAEAERQICACFEKLLPTLKPAHEALLRQVDLQDEPVAQAAANLGITPNNASVTLHRARRDLRSKLIDFCGDCACLDDCECE